MMFYENETEVAAQRDNPERTGPYWDAWNAYMGALYPTGIILKGDALLPPAAATSVRLEGGKRLVQDGPVASTKEQLAGYVVIEVPDLDAALSWAALKAQLLQKLGTDREATETAFQRAIGLTEDGAVRAYLIGRSTHPTG
jgi:hypothetical protein